MAVLFSSSSGSGDVGDIGDIGDMGDLSCSELVSSGLVSEGAG